MNNFEYIKACVSREELLLMLAEEAAELSQAALKLRRKLIGINPTPKSLEECEADFREETADVNLCLVLLGLKFEPEVQQVQAVEDCKADRWVNRLKGNPCATCKFKNRPMDQEPCCRCDERVVGG